MLVFKRKQIVVLSMLLLIIVAGVIQYNIKQSSVAVSGDDQKIGDTVYVENDTKDGKPGIAMTASKQANDFFAQAKLDRDVSRNKDTEALKTVTNDTTVTKEVKAKAQERVVQITSNSQKENRIEILIKETGFSDVVALFGDDGSVDIVVKAPNLTSAQVAKISDIVTRQANIPLNKVVIKNIF